MVIFKTVIISILGFCLTTGTLSQREENQDEQLWPSKDVGEVSLSTIHFLLKSPSPLQNCIFTLPTGSEFDFSRGHDSPKIGEFNGYHGLGLAKGECGCSFDVTNTSFEGVVSCRAKKVGSSHWIKSASTLRVTGISKKLLPSFDIAPRRATLQVGDEVTVTCNAPGQPLEVCRFIMPDGKVVKLDRGPSSRRSDEYRYFGKGLANGECGITLRTNAKHNGQIVCKIGKKPFASNGRWNMGVMVIETKGRSEELVVTKSSDVLSRPARQRVTAKPLTTPKPSGSGKPVTTPRPSSTSRPTTAQPGTDCGHNRLSQVAMQISGGDEAAVGEYPWHAGIYKMIGDTYHQQCGGTLITPKVVLTAAHCFVSELSLAVGNITLYRIGLGKHLRDYAEKDPEGNRVQKFKLKEIIVHPSYRGRKENFQYDIAVVLLNKGAKITDYVDIICMDWDSSSKKLQLADGKVGVTVGWGATETESSSKELQYVKLPYVSGSVCQAAINEGSQVNNYYTPDKFCAGFRNMNTSVCKGDSGGGLYFMNSTTHSFFLRGVTSVSFVISSVRGQCANQLYTGFTDVATYIKDLIEPALLKSSL